MTYNEIMKTISNVKGGAYIAIQYARKCKTKKGVPDITKITRTVARVGINYENINAVKEMRVGENSVHIQSHELNGLVWKQFPYLLENPQTGKIYFRLIATNSQYCQTKTEYLINGIQQKKEDIENFLYSSEKNSGNKPLVYNINIDDIVYIKSGNYSNLL